MGNASKESIVEIWNGAVYADFKKDLLKGKKQIYEMCKKCVLPNHNCSDNIDKYAEEILKKIE